MGLTLDEAGARVGHLCWAERRLFEVLGAWAPSTPELEAKLLLDRHSQHFAWRSTQWWDRLPVLAEVDRESLVVAPGDAEEALGAALEGLGDTTSRLAGAYRVALPRLAGAYARLRGSAGPVAEGPLLRLLDLLEPDLASDWREGELLCQRLLASAADVEAAARAVGRLEGLLVPPSG